MDTHIPVGRWFETFIEWLTAEGAPVFDAINALLTAIIDGMETALLAVPGPVMIALMVLLAWWLRGWLRWGLAAFSLASLSLVYVMELWPATMQTLALVIAATVLALVVGIPLGVIAGRSDRAQLIVRPIMDFMQTMPAFVYLIPAVLFFQLGKVPGTVATVIFAMPPAVRLTSLGIRQVPHEVEEASLAFGATGWQQLMKVHLPLALPSVLAGMNQSIMLALSMVVIASMIGAGGLGDQVLKGITQLRIGLGFESGLAVVAIAMYLDRVTQALGEKFGASRQ